MEANKIIQGNALEELKKLPEKSINMCVTSPPYWNLRDYGNSTETIWDGNPNCEHEFETEERYVHRGSANNTIHGAINAGGLEVNWKTQDGFCKKCGAWKGQLGLEPDFNLYIKHLCDIFDQVKRVLRDDGTLWVNIGDTYGGSGGSSGHKENTKNLGYLTKNMGAIANGTKTYQSKSLVMIPFRFAIEMCKRRGFIIPDERDRSWLAGIIEGEGCIAIHKRENNRKNATYGNFLSVSNTDKKIIDRIIKLTGMGGNVQIQEAKDKTKKIYRWNAMSNNAKKILREVYPYMVSKRDQIRCALFCPSSGKDAEECWDNLKRLHQQKNTSREYPEPQVGGIDPWILRNVIIWKKNNCMPSSVRDRFTVDFEYLFFFSKKKKYYFEQQFEPLSEESIKDIIKRKNLAKLTGEKGSKHFGKGGNYEGKGRLRTEYYNLEKGRNKRTVWTINPKPFKEAHFAVYPEELVETPIKAGCPGNGIVLDPFFGSGTTGLSTLKQGKRFIGIELNPDYIEIANKRLKPFLEQEKLK